MSLASQPSLASQLFLVAGDDIARRLFNDGTDPFGFGLRPRPTTHMQGVTEGMKSLSHHVGRRVAGHGAGSEVHAGHDAVDGIAVCCQERLALLRDRIEFLGALGNLATNMILVFKQRQRWVDRTWARRIGPAELLLDGSYKIVAMARSFRDQRENNQPQIAMTKDPATSTAAEAPEEATGTFTFEAFAAPAPASSSAAWTGRELAFLIPSATAAPTPETLAPTVGVMMSSKHSIYLSFYL
jgi:hypothetical protein